MSRRRETSASSGSRGHGGGGGGRLVGSVPAALLKAHLTCAVCLSVIDEAWTVKSCLHRFCRACIEMSLRLGRRECPSCRAHCPSRRNLRPDRRFDAIVRAVFPNLQQLEQETAQLVKEAIAAHNHRAIAASIGKAIEKQQAQRRSVPFSSSSAAAASMSTSSASLTRRCRRTTLLRAPRRPGRRNTKPATVCLQRGKNCRRLGPQVRQWFVVPRQATLRDLANAVRHRFAPADAALQVKIGVQTDAVANTVEEVDMQSCVDDLIHFFAGGDEEALVLVYSSV